MTKSKKYLLNMMSVAISVLLVVLLLASPQSFAVEENHEIAPETSVNLDDMTEENAVMDELLMLVDEGVSKREINNIVDEAGASPSSIGKLDNGTKLVKISLDDEGDAQAVADSLIAQDDVIIVQPNYKYHLDTNENTENDEGMPEVRMYYDSSVKTVTEEVTDNQISQWYLGNNYFGSVQAIDSWNELTNDNTAIVAVIDTGVNLNHPDIKDVIITEKCVTFNNGEKMDFTAGDNSDDDDGHGTHVCGIIAANATDNFGISGVSDNRARLIVIDAADTNYDFYTEDVVKGIDYAVECGASVINMSIGALYKDYILEDGVNRAYGNGALCICAAGNENSDLPESPGDAFGAISVMAHDENGKRASFSNYGIEKDVSAPGVDIVSSYIGDNDDTVVYKVLSGTSMAAPVVSGIAALIKSENPELNPREIKNYIYTSSGDGSYTDYGFGRVNARNALEAMSGDSDPRGIVLNKKSVNMYPGESAYIEYALYPASASTYADDIEFKSSNPAVVKVDEKSGVINAVSAGKVTVTASIRGVDASCTVNVQPVPSTAISSLPFISNGTFSPTDPKVAIEHTQGSVKETWEAMADRYTVELITPTTISINVKSEYAVPYVRIFDASGEPQRVRQKINNNKLSALFRPNKSEKYTVEISGGSFGSSIVNKPYSLDIRVEGTEASIGDAVISGVIDRTYSGAAITQNPLVQYKGQTLKEGSNYKLEYKNNVSAGTAYMTVTGKGSLSGSKTVSFRIAKAGNTIKTVGKTASVKKSKLKKIARTVAISKLATIRNAQGRLTYAKVSGSKKLSINKSTGKVTVKKKTKKGKYKMKIKVTAAGNTNYHAASRYVTVTVRVK